MVQANHLADLQAHVGFLAPLELVFVDGHGNTRS
jgi:hypothetical protein